MIEEIKRRYKQLYTRLKATVPELIEKERIPPMAKRQILTVVSNLPHPSVASLADIREVCLTCIAGVLKCLYQHFGDEAKELYNMVGKVIEDLNVDVGDLLIYIEDEKGNILLKKGELRPI